MLVSCCIHAMKTNMAAAAASNVSIDKLDSFSLTSNKLASLVYSKTEGHKKTLQVLLNEFNASEFVCNSAKNRNRAVLVINHFCNLVPPDEKDLVVKTCQFFDSLISKNKLEIEGKTLSLVVTWCLECLKADVREPVLKCLQALIRNNYKSIQEYGEQIISEVGNVVTTAMETGKSGTDEAIVLHGLKCLRLIAVSDPAEAKSIQEKKVSECFRLFRQYLFAEKVLLDEAVRCKCAVTAMKGIGNGVDVLSDMNDRLGEILGIVKFYMFYGLPGYQEYMVEKLYPSRITVPENMRISNAEVKKPKGKYDRKSKKVNFTCMEAFEEKDDAPFNSNVSAISEKTSLYFGCSDSDFSDLEGGENTKITWFQSKVRLCAILLLQTLIQKIGTKTFLSYLPCFLSDGLDNVHTRTLMTCVSKDPSSKCRFEACGILSTVISDSKQYFFQADFAPKSSFTALACNIGSTIKELHRSLGEALKSEDSPTVLSRLLKCVSDLVRCSPYYKLEPGLISSIANRVEIFLKHKDVNVRISALNVFGCIVSVETKISEINDIVLTFKEDESLTIGKCLSDCTEKGDFEDSKQKPWLLRVCLSCFQDKSFCFESFNCALVIESLQVLGALVRNYFCQTLITFPNDFFFVLDHCSKKSEYPIRLYSGKLMETIFNSLQYNLLLREENEKELENFITGMWNRLLRGPVTRLIRSDKEPMLKCTGCDCIANVGVQINNVQSSPVQSSFIFDLLEKDSQIICITYLFACARDDSPAVRSSAIRALAIFVLFPSLKEDGLFLLDVIDVALSSATDEHINVRTQSAWLMGNVTESIASNNATGFDDGVADSSVLNILRICIKLADDAPKIRPGALRAIGNLLNFFDETYIQKHKDQVNRGIEVLLKNATEGSFMKARWNSCYALANVLRNPSILAIDELITRILDAMIGLIQNYRNFKVRIGAGCVLIVPPDRRYYRDRFYSVWSAVFNALENSKNIPDYKEYQHRDHLLDQICLVMCHLISLMESDDLFFLRDYLNYHLNNVQHHMKMFQSRIVPERSELVLKALDNISNLESSKILKEDQHKTIYSLKNLFTDNF